MKCYGDAPFSIGSTSRTQAAWQVDDVVATGLVTRLISAVGGCGWPKPDADASVGTPMPAVRVSSGYGPHDVGPDSV